MAEYENVFSDFEVRETAITFAGATAAIEDDCVGTLSIEENVRKITKKCRGVVVKSTVKHDGTIKLTISMHMKWPVFKQMFGYDATGLKGGVYALNRDKSVHPSFVMTNHVYDEDGNEKYFAFPNCKATAGLKEKIDNGASEVAELEVEIEADVDDNGNSMYECMASELTDTAVATSWMSAWKYDLVKATA